VLDLYCTLIYGRKKACIWLDYEAVARTRSLYTIEYKEKTLAACAHSELGQRKAATCLQELKSWLEKQLTKVLSKRLITKTIKYTLKPIYKQRLGSLRFAVDSYILQSADAHLRLYQDKWCVHRVLSTVESLPVRTLYLWTSCTSRTWTLPIPKAGYPCHRKAGLHENTADCVHPLATG